MQKKLNISFKHALSQKSIYIAALSTCLIAVVAFAVLSHLIAEDNRKNNEDFAKKRFSENMNLWKANSGTLKIISICFVS